MLEEDDTLTRISLKRGNYDNGASGCPNCGRFRLILGDDGKHRCEKCCWCVEDKDYDPDARYL